MARGVYKRKPFSKEHREHLSEAMKGNKYALRHILSHEVRKEISRKLKGKEPWNKGKIGVYSEKTREKISNALMGRNLLEETKIKISMANKGVKKSPFTEEHKNNISLSRIGGKHWNWQGGLTAERSRISNSREYKNWRKSVFERDNYTCQECGAKSGNGYTVVLNADHIKPFAYFPELRLDLNNGKTLCVPCHKETDTYAYKSIKKYEYATT